MPENDRKPSLRFKGFNDAWEQCELNQVTDVRDGTHESPKYVNEGFPFITSKNVKDGYINYDDIQYITKNDFDNINKRSKVDINDILMGMIGTIGNLALIRQEPDFAIKNVALIKDIGKVNYKYLYQYLQSTNTLKQLQDGLDGGTQKFVSLSRVRSLSVWSPSLNEQTVIGEFLDSFDSLITLHQRKYDKLVSVKKALLDKMFPENGNDVPKVRFKGFTDAWEQCELGDLTDLYVGSSFTQELSDDGKFIVMDMGSVSQDGFRVELKRTNIERDMLKKDDLVMPKDDIGGGLIIAKTAHIPTENTHLLGDHVFRLRFFKEDGLFMHYLINSNKVNSNLKKKVTGSAQLGIRGVNVKNEIVNLPSVEEQAQIGDLFNNIDTLITLHQRKHEKLQNIKKALLSKMFA